MKMEMMKLNQSNNIQKVFIAIIVIYAALINVIKLSKELQNFNTKTDMAVQYEEKLNPIRKILPSGIKIGYKNDEKDVGKFTESLYLTQYALAPNAVLTNEISDFIIASFNNPKQKAIYIKKNKLRLVQNIDNKMALYTREQE
jgi:hypothetical protein